jgi:hypothetical protein
MMLKYHKWPPLAEWAKAKSIPKCEENGESLLAFTKNECKNQQLMVALKKTAN